MTLEELGVDHAIDVHAHPPTSTFLHEAGGQMMADAAARFGTDRETWSYEEMIAEYQDVGIDRAVLLAWDAETNTGNPPVTNDHVASVRDDHEDFFVGFASVDPHKDDCRETAVRAVEDLDLSGFKFQQIAQGFDPSDPAYESLFDTIEDLDVPVIFHGGTSTLGAGAPGGRGLRIEYGHPIMVDRVAAAHPDLDIILAHPAFPWEQEQLAVCQQKGNVWMDLSGWLPKYIDEQVLHYAGTMLQDSVLFGTDYPMIRPEKWVQSFQEHTAFDQAVIDKLFWENATDLFDI